ncbi:GNAT family N-acetyltransferase [Flavobacterium sp.]|uniref:GNAT family N-acetyltransferase n=1 Tax=Flavobacterium sp. TaxID=239 RepID=UPI0008BE6506|nr:GNAT family N-acetyltransferase [Flavobacterium sp.]OGS63154.1 MAG: GNAT family N-acetyltransferase [Flavobacteria bacterium GWF1_32_7]HBD26691.1 N-acetyltransferase [Flavobacterium sp.]
MTTFKPLEIKDISVITQMMQDFYAIDNYPMDIEVAKNLFQEFISNDHLGKSWLIYSENEIVGYIILTFIFSFEYGGKIAFVDELFIKETARGKGIGKEAIQFIQREVPKLSLKLLYLEVEPRNENAQKLYLAHDFELHNRKLMKYKVTK